MAVAPPENMEKVWLKDSAIAFSLSASIVDMEMMQKEIMIEGLLSIQAGENPRVIEEKLKSFMAPDERKSPDDNGGEVDG